MPSLPWTSIPLPNFSIPNITSQERQRTAVRASVEELANAQPLLPGAWPDSSPIERSSDVIMEYAGNLEATVEGHLETVPDADVDQEMVSPQQYEEAANNGEYHAIRSLVDHSADPKAEDYNQGTQLSLASRNGTLENVRLLLEQGEDVDYQDSTGWTPLHEASAQGHHDVVQLLLEHDADVDAQTNSRWTPLHIASLKLKGELVKLLLEYEADVLARNKKDQTFLDVAWASGHKDIDVYARYTDKRTVLHIAAQHGDREFMCWLIDRGADADAEDENKETPLFPASRNGILGATQLLLEHQAKVDHRNWKERTPLHGALGNEHPEVAQLLLERGADVKAKDVYKWTPLHLASQTGMHTVTKELIKRGANVNAQNDFDWTPLHMASQKGNVDVVKVLLASNADVRIQNSDGETALHLSAYYGMPGVRDVLLKKDADLLLHIPNKEGKTPLDLESEEGHKDIARALGQEVGNPVAIGSETSSHTISGSTTSDRSSGRYLQPSSTTRYPGDHYLSPSVFGFPEPIGWSPPTRGPTPPSPGSAYPQHGRFQQGNTTQWGGGFPQPDSGAYRGPNSYGSSSSSRGSSSSGYNRPVPQTNSFSSSRLLHASPPVVRDECDDWFDSIDADGNGELSYQELHAALLNNNGGPLFLTTTVKYLVSIFDRDGDGVIRKDEFRPLWEYLNNWRRMFDSFDTDHDGRIDAGELGRALGYYGIQVNRVTLDKLVRKHSDARRGMDLDQFVCACVVVRRMCQLYDSCNAGGGSSISRDDFLQAIIALP